MPEKNWHPWKPWRDEPVTVIVSVTMAQRRNNHENRQRVADAVCEAALKVVQDPDIEPLVMDVGVQGRDIPD